MADTMDVRTSLAMGRGAIAVSPFEGLLRAEGLPLDLSRGDHHAVVVFPSSCCAQHREHSFGAPPARPRRIRHGRAHDHRVGLALPP